MNSDDLGTLGFRQWSPFNRASERQVLGSAPRAEGVYVIRMNAPMPRMRGASDILYSALR